MSGLLSTINPGLVLILAGVIAGLTPIQRVRQGLALVAPVLALVMLLAAPRETDLATMSLMGFDMVLYRVDSLSFIFALAFLIAAFINAVYALHNDNQLEDSMAMSYMGAAVAACFCGDFISLFVFWELTAVTSVFLILRAGTRAAYFASMRYLGVQILSGVLLLAGIGYVYQSRGDLSISAFTSLNEPGALLVFIALGIKAAFPFLHNWLQDSYPKATVVGAVVLSAFTTKLAVFLSTSKRSSVGTSARLFLFQKRCHSWAFFASCPLSAVIAVMSGAETMFHHSRAMLSAGSASTFPRADISAFKSSSKSFLRSRCSSPVKLPRASAAAPTTLG